MPEVGTTHTTKSKRQQDKDAERAAHHTQTRHAEAQEAHRMPAGRPSGYSDEIADELCLRIADSDYGLEKVCEAEDMPSAATVYRWLNERGEFREKYARAREIQGHVQADRGLRDAIDAKDAQLGRLRWDARRWHAAKLAPRTFGDSVQVKHADAEGQTIDLSATSAAARLAALFEAVRNRQAASPALLGSNAEQEDEPSS